MRLDSPATTKHAGHMIHCTNGCYVKVFQKPELTDIKIGRKIGKGAFGDVYEAHLDGQLVAVKTCRSDDVWIWASS